MTGNSAPNNEHDKLHSFSTSELDSNRDPHLSLTPSPIVNDTRQLAVPTQFNVAMVPNKWLDILSHQLPHCTQLLMQ